MLLNSASVMQILAWILTTLSISACMKKHRRATLGMNLHFFPLIKYSEEIEVIVGTENVLYWFAISFFTKSSLMCLFYIQIYFSYSFIHWFLILCNSWPWVSSKNIQNTGITKSVYILMTLWGINSLLIYG